MQMRYRTPLLCFLMLGALVSPVLTSTASAGAARVQHEQRRVYDRVYRDYHPWTGDEDRKYHEFLTERHLRYRAYGKLNDREQREYWKWHHTHSSDERR